MNQYNIPFYLKNREPQSDLFLPFAYFLYLVKLSNLEHFFIFLNKKQEEKRAIAPKHKLGLLVLAKEDSETDCCFRV